MTDQQVSHELTIESGVHKGATIEFLDNVLLLIGTASDCDIVLSDQDIHSYHCAILKCSDGIFVRSLGGEATIGKTVIAEGEAVSYSQAQVVHLTETDVSFSIAERLQGPVAQLETSRQSRDMSSHKYFVAMLGAGLLLVAFMTMQFTSTSAREKLQDTTPQPNIQEIVAALNLTDQIRYMKPASSDSLPLIQGVLKKTSGESLQQALIDAGIATQWQVTYVEDLLERVINIFRTNGYSVEVAYAGGAQVNVLNLDDSNPDVKKVVEHVYADVPELEILDFSIASGSAPDDNSPSLYALLPGKRLTTIVDGPTAYVATEDGSRYFVGSVLPGGGQIRVITEAGVQVESNGALTWMRF